MDYWLSRLLLFVAASMPLSAATVVTAQERPAAYAITAWTPDAGLPDQAGNILAITQDIDGYLWLGTTRGLFRFDGLGFHQWGAGGERPLPSDSIRTIAAARNGSIWVGYGDIAGVSELRRGEWVHHSEPEGLRGAVVQALIEDRTGRIWVGGSRGLLKFESGAWHAFGPEDGVPHGQVFSVYEDRRGRIWAGTAMGVVASAPGADTFAVVDPAATFVQGMVEDSGGTVWATDRLTLLRVPGDGSTPPYSPAIRLPAAGWRLLSDASGGIWVAALGVGLLRMGKAGDGAVPPVEPFTDSRITGSVQALFKDRENNVWVGMRGGLLRVSESFVVNNTPVEGLMNEGVRGMTVSPDGSVWVGTTYAVNRFAGGERQVFTFEQTQALHADRSGMVWLVTLQGIYKFADGRFIAAPVPPGVRLENVSSLTSEATGALWFCDRRAGVIRWDQSEVNRFEDVPDVFQRPCAVPYADRHGRVWVGFSMGGVALYQNGRFRLYGQADGLGGGSVTSIAEDRSGAIWMSTAEGISRFDGGRFITVTPRNGLPGRTASLVEDDEGFLWASGARGLVRFNPREVDRLASDPSYQIEFTLYDRSDGLPPSLASQSRPSSVRARDGTMWFASQGGVSILEPKRLRPVRGPAVPRIENVLVDGRAAAGGSDAITVPHGSSLEIAYSALSLSAASKLRFRYRLDGHQPEWTYAGEARQATFANLPAGEYRFRVTTTHDGVWREPEAMLAFTVQPPFYRANWFYALAAMAVLLAIWSSWRLRLRAIRGRHALVLAERARVSRDIHDTLLQSLTAVGLELEVVARLVGSTHPVATDAVRDCQHRVAECIREARQSVWNLRSSTLERLGLGEALRELAANAVPGRGPRIDVNVRGAALAFSAQAEEELLRIAREAIANAVRHGDAQHVTVDLEYGDRAATLRVTDDGRGFVASEVTNEGGHCGLRNMRERAAALRGELRVASTPGSGTIVEVTVPMVWHLPRPEPRHVADTSTLRG